jgi:hypothetical protein
MEAAEMTPKMFFMICRVLAVACLLASGLMEALYNPGLLDALNGLAHGLAIFCIWRAGSEKDDEIVTLKADLEESKSLKR